MKIIECVPNFSEGRDLSIIRQITDEIESVEGVRLLDVDPGADTNRTVVTFIGTPEVVQEAAFKAIAKAAELIDMTKHKGAHARQGATDVCPFVPVSDVTMEECIACAHAVGKRVGEELNIPVYLYEYAASTPERRNLAYVRREYESLEKRLQDPHWKPDYGEAKFNARSGATQISARDFLIAYNINLNTRDVKKSRKIAFHIREKGYPKRDENKKIIKDKNGEMILLPGIFKHVKGTGWYLPEHKHCQVSMNLTNYHVSSLHEVFDKVCELANEIGVRVTGSELVGLTPKEVLIDAGHYFLQKQGVCHGVADDELIRVAIESLGLNDTTPFDPKTKIIESYLMDDENSLVAMTAREFADELGSDSPAPGGGSVAALAASLSAALSSMVAHLTYPKPKYAKIRKELNDVAVRAQACKHFFLNQVDDDTQAFNQVMAAMRLPKKTPEEQSIRKAAILKANKGATQIPFDVLARCQETIELAEFVINEGNPNSLSDAGVAALMARAGADGAYYNVLINLASINDDDYVNTMKINATKIREDIVTRSQKLQKILLERLS